METLATIMVIAGFISMLLGAGRKKRNGSIEGGSCLLLSLGIGLIIGGSWILMT